MCVKWRQCKRIRRLRDKIACCCPMPFSTRWHASWILRNEQKMRIKQKCATGDALYGNMQVHPLPYAISRLHEKPPLFLQRCLTQWGLQYQTSLACINSDFVFSYGSPIFFPIQGPNTPNYIYSLVNLNPCSPAADSIECNLVFS